MLWRLSPVAEAGDTLLAREMWVDEPIRMTITAVYQKRIQDITEAEARAAGYYDEPGAPWPTEPLEWLRHYFNFYNPDNGWDTNPLVWSVGFTVEPRP
jgi:hypothetical protein